MIKKLSIALSLVFAIALSTVSLALAKHACSVGAPLENCSHERASCTDIKRSLALQKTGLEVIQLQKYLKVYGYLEVEPSGYFGPKTFKAVRDFQSAYNLEATGTVGPLTRAQIKNNSCQPLVSEVLPEAPRVISCSQELRLCPGGRSMGRSTSTCAWLENTCTTTASTPSADGTGLWNTWNQTKSAPTDPNLFTQLKDILKGLGIPTDFATSTLTEAEILQLTRKFEQQYLGR